MNVPSCRLLVCGGRDFGDRAVLERALDVVASLRQVGVVIHGAAPGADSLTADWAKSRGLPVLAFPALAFPAQWQKDGALDRGAGFARNERMLREGKPDMGVGFPRASGRLGNGTRHMLSLLIASRVPAFLMEQGCWRRLESPDDLDFTESAGAEVMA